MKTISRRIAEVVSDLREHAYIKIDQWMQKHGGNRQLRLRDISPVSLNRFIDYCVITSREDDSVWGLGDPIVHYSTGGLDFVSQFLTTWQGFKSVEVRGSTFRSAIVALDQDFCVRSQALPALLDRVRIELASYKTATASQVRGAINRARIRLWWDKQSIKRPATPFQNELAFMDGLVPDGPHYGFDLFSARTINDAEG